MKRTGKKKERVYMDPSKLTTTQRFFWVIREYWVDMVLINLAFVVFCLPVFTIPAALSALSQGFYRMYRGQDVHIFRDFWRDIRQGFVRSLLPGVILIVGALIAFFAIRKAYSAVSLGVFLPAAIFLWVFAAVSFSAYAIPMAALTDLPMGTVLKNALILVFAYAGRNVGALLLTAALTLLIVITAPVSVPLLLVIHFALCAHILLSFAWEGLSRCMIFDDSGENG